MSDENTIDTNPETPKRGRPKKAPATPPARLSEEARLTVKAARATIRAVQAEVRILDEQAKRAQADLDRVGAVYQIGLQDLVDDETGAITRASS